MGASHAVRLTLIALAHDERRVDELSLANEMYLDLFGATCQATRLTTGVLGSFALGGVLTLRGSDDMHVPGWGGVVGGGRGDIVLSWGTEEKIRHCRCVRA